MKRIILASASPRRREIMQMIGMPFEVIVSNADEMMNEELPVKERIIDIARQKAKAVFDGNNDAIVIGCDTVVLVDDQILGKPKDKDQAREMFLAMRGGEHIVLSAVCIMSEEETCCFADETEVHFNDMSDEEIEEYISTEEPYDKAGAYAIQGRSGVFIREIRGNYYNVVGLPVDRIYGYLKKRLSLFPGE